MEREKLEFDVLFVGAGPANLAGAIHLKKLAQQQGRDIEVCIIEKAESIGAHSLSGAVLDPKALIELMPDFREKGCPIEETDLRDGVFYLTATGQLRLPYTPPYMHNEGCFIISLSKFCAWLGTIAEELGVNIFPGFAGVEALYDEAGRRVIGVRTGDKGVNKDGKPKIQFRAGGRPAGQGDGLRRGAQGEPDPRGRHRNSAFLRAGCPRSSKPRSRK